MAFRGTMSTRIADWKKLFFVKIGAMRKKHTLLAFSEDSMAFLDVKSRNVEHVFSGTELDKIKLSKDQTQFVVYIKKKKTTVISPHRPEILNEIYTLMTQGVDAVFPGSRIRANGERSNVQVGVAGVTIIKHNVSTGVSSVECFISEIQECLRASDHPNFVQLRLNNGRVVLYELEEVDRFIAFVGECAGKYLGLYPELASFSVEDTLQEKRDLATTSGLVEYVVEKVFENGKRKTLQLKLLETGFVELDMQGHFKSFCLYHRIFAIVYQHGTACRFCVEIQNGNILVFESYQRDVIVSNLLEMCDCCSMHVDLRAEPAVEGFKVEVVGAILVPEYEESLNKRLCNLEKESQPFDLLAEYGMSIARGKSSCNQEKALVKCCTLLTQIDWSSQVLEALSGLTVLDRLLSNRACFKAFCGKDSAVQTLIETMKRHVFSDNLLSVGRTCDCTFPSPCPLAGEITCEIVHRSVRTVWLDFALVSCGMLVSNSSNPRMTTPWRQSRKPESCPANSSKPSSKFWRWCGKMNLAPCQHIFCWKSSNVLCIAAASAPTRNCDFTCWNTL